MTKEELLKNWALGIPREEQETILRWDEAEKMLWAYTSSRWTAAKLLKTCDPTEVYKDKQGKVVGLGVRVGIEKFFYKIRDKRKATQKQKEAMARIRAMKGESNAKPN